MYQISVHEYTQLGHTAGEREVDQRVGGAWPYDMNVTSCNSEHVAKRKDCAVARRTRLEILHALQYLYVG